MPELSRGGYRTIEPSPTFPTQAKKPGISRGHPQKSPLQGGCGGLNDLASCGDPRSRLDGQVEVELLHEELLIGIEFRIAAEDQLAPVRCGEVDIEHLDSSEFVDDGSRSEAARERPQPRPQGDGRSCRSSLRFLKAASTSTNWI